mmetsp:Transcript_17758/g.32070  ORF Transcript_17758/g.32070 Transcript_17758/m.32070 type:complete len:249 (-) Transcript_17758:152-898(-)
MQRLVFRPSDIVGKKNPPRCGLGLPPPGVNHLVTGVLLLRDFGITALNGILNVRHLVWFDGPLLCIVIVVSRGLEVVLDAEGLDGESDDARLIRLGLHGMILNFDVDVIVNVSLHGVASDESHGESLPVTGSDRGLVLHLRRGGDVVHDPIVVIIFADSANHLIRADAFLFPPSEIGDAELFAEHVHLHVDAVWRGFDAVARQKFAEVFVIHFGSAFWLAEGQAVIVHGEERFLGGHFVHLEFHAFAL